MPHKDPEVRKAYRRAWLAKRNAEDPEYQERRAKEQAAYYQKKKAQDESFDKRRKENYARWYAEYGKENSRARKGQVPVEEYLAAKAEKAKQRAAYMREWYKTEAGIRSAINQNLKHSFGMTIEDYEVLYHKQGGKCRICGVSRDCYDRDRDRLFVDHCHRTGRIRGLLCRNCNSGIGLFLDKKENLLNAIEYLREFQSDTEE